MSKHTSLRCHHGGGIKDKNKMAMKHPLIDADHPNIFSDDPNRPMLPAVDNRTPGQMTRDPRPQIAWTPPVDNRTGGPGRGDPRSLHMLSGSDAARYAAAHKQVQLAHALKRQS
jgi:hypothetical protein